MENRPKQKFTWKELAMLTPLEIKKF